jgi:DNA-binding NarL/FixJ family response regulator
VSIKVAIVEDDADIRESLTELISGSPMCELTDVCKDAADALKKLPQRPPEVVLMDINMPGMNGVECVRQLKTILPEVNILMLTVYEDGDWLFESLKAGASGYLLKRTTSARLLKAISEVNSGGAPMTPQIAKRVVRFFSSGPPARSAAKGTEVSGLTANQMEFLELLAAGYAYKEIADKLGITMDGVRSYVRKIYEKLHVHSRTEAVVKFLNR